MLLLEPQCQSAAMTCSNGFRGQITSRWEQYSLHLSIIFIFWLNSAISQYCPVKLKPLGEYLPPSACWFRSARSLMDGRSSLQDSRMLSVRKWDNV